MDFGGKINCNRQLLIKLPNIYWKRFCFLWEIKNYRAAHGRPAGWVLQEKRKERSLLLITTDITVDHISVSKSSRIIIMHLGVEMDFFPNILIMRPEKNSDQSCVDVKIMTIVFVDFNGIQNGYFHVVKPLIKSFSCM